MPVPVIVTSLRLVAEYTYTLSLFPPPSSLRDHRLRRRDECAVHTDEKPLRERADLVLIYVVECTRMCACACTSGCASVRAQGCVRERARVCGGAQICERAYVRVTKTPEIPLPNVGVRG